MEAKTTVSILQYSHFSFCHFPFCPKDLEANFGPAKSRAGSGKGPGRSCYRRVANSAYNSIKEFTTWKSSEAARSPPSKDRPTGLRERCGLTPCSRQAIRRSAVGASVTFEPCARTAWHTHPLGQTLIVTAGCGLVQRWGGPIEEIRPGDVIWFAPGEKHWHGATATTAVTHIAIQEQLNGKTVDWMEQVSEEQYQST